MVPGIECEAEPSDVHVLGYHVGEFIGARDVAGIARAIRGAGGFAVLAHPLYREAWRHVGPGALAALHGFEVWNGKADGGLYPSDGAIRRLADVARDGASLVPMAGADLHRLEADPGIVLEVECAGREAGHIVDALARRAFRVRGRAWAFAAGEPMVTPPRTLRRVMAQAMLDTRRRAERVHGWLTRRGLGAPAPVARAARRLLP
jgi:hypothetical protein